MPPTARGMLKTAAAVAAFGLLHSLLASRTAKREAARLVGERNRDGLYRLFYNTQSAVTTGLLVAYAARQPGRELYQVSGGPRVLMHAGQVACLGMMTAAVRELGFGEISGLANAADWAAGRRVRPEPEAQGPAVGGETRLRTGGPYRLCRHPLNFWAVPLIWLSPRMTTTLAAFNAAATVYLVWGSAREDERLAERFGAAYERYRGEVPFFVPMPGVVRRRLPEPAEPAQWAPASISAAEASGCSAAEPRAFPAG